MTRRSRSEAGFILPMTLVVIAVLGLALWSAMAVLDSMQRDLLRLTAGLRLETEAQRAEARVAYLMLSEPFGQTGLRIGGMRISRDEEFGITKPEEVGMGEERPVERMLWFDGRPYGVEGGSEAGGGFVVRIQDEAGLFNLNKLDPEETHRLLLALGHKDETARRLADALADYVDEDEGRRLNGAERPEYAFEDMPPPTNRPLRDVAEIWNVLHWKELLAPRERAVIREIAAASLNISLSNMNTAGPETLMAWFNLTRQQADDLIEERMVTPLISLQDIMRVTGATPQSEEFRLYAFPSRRVRLRVFEGGENPARMFETWLTLAEYSADRPYYRGRFSLIESPPNLSDAKGAHVEPSPLPESERLLPR
jgi:hypothetical protein